MSGEGGWVPPPYPYDRLDDLRPQAEAHDGGAVDLSIGTPCDPPPPAVVAALSTSGAERGYPPSIGSQRFRRAAVDWMGRRFGVDVPLAATAACVGTKELVVGLPAVLRLRTPSKDTVLYPAISYPSYEMGAVLAGCRAVAYADLAAVDPGDADRALCLWVNSPGNPAGQLDDLPAAAAWGRAHGVPVLSDECYAEFTWDGLPHTILEGGLDGVLAVHSLSKRSNLAGVRAGFYAGDPALVQYLMEVRKHAGLMPPGPVQAAAATALEDDVHVDEQRERYLQRLQFLAGVLTDAGIPTTIPRGGFYLWPEAPDGDAWALTGLLAAKGGALVSPGEFYGQSGAGHVRIAVVQPLERLELVARRLSS